MLLIRLRVCVKYILLYELCIWTRFFSFLPRTFILRSLHRGSCGQTYVKQRLLRFSLDGWKWIRFLCLFYKKPCEMLFSFLRYYMRGSSLVKKFAYMHGPHGCTKIRILIFIKRGWQCKVGKKRFTPNLSEDPSRFELFCLYQNSYNG